MIDPRPPYELPPYVFAELNRMKAEAAAAGQDVIDFGMGNPDLAPPDFVVDALCEAARRPLAHQYSVSSGIDTLKQAQANYYARRFGVDLDWRRNVCVTMGSKEGFATLARAITRPGDKVLVPAPCYPIHTFGFVLAGGIVEPMPTAPNEDYFRAAQAAMDASGPSPVAMILNYPGNPTTEVADLAFYEEAVAFARRHRLILISDLAYAEIYFGETPPPSVFQIPGAEDVAVEFTSVSKTFSMAGWRMGFCVGNEKIVSALTSMKSYLDYGSFLPAQMGAAAALDHSEECSADVRETYRSRRDLLVESFAAAGLHLPLPGATMFVWSKIPEGFGRDSLAFAKTVLRETGVVVSPGIGFGEAGEGHFRIALVQDEDRTKKAADQIAGWLRRGDETVRRRA